MGAFLPKGIEWVIILIVVLIIFGPKNLPKLGAALGKSVKNLRAGLGKKKKDPVEGEAAAENGAAASADGQAGGTAPAVSAPEAPEVQVEAEVVEASAEAEVASSVSEAASEPVSATAGDMQAEQPAATEAGSAEQASPKVVKRTVVRKKVQE